MSLPPCVARHAQLFPDGSTKYFCGHPQFPYHIRLLVETEYCETCPLRQATGTLPPPPPPTPTPPPATPDPAAYTPDQPRPDLKAIELTLPSPDQEQRTFPRPIFEPDGAISYPVGDNDWEPPRDISGYIRDPNNPWRFLPLWLPCGLRLPKAFLKAACGCIDINMQCNHPEAATFGQPVPYTACKTCQHRS